MNLLRLVFSLGVGFVIGYLHTSVAIVMLFRPHREFRVLGLRFQGMIPRRRADIARSVARIVSSDLLKEERVAQRIAGPEVRFAFEKLAADLAGRLLEKDYGTLRQTLGEGACRTAEEALGGLLREGARVLGSWARTPQGGEVLTSVTGALLDRSLADLLPGEEAELRRLAAVWSLSSLASADLESRLRSSFRLLTEHFAGIHAPLAQAVPPEAVEVLRRTIRNSVPSVLAKFEVALLTPQNVERIKGAVRSGVRAYLLETEGGVVKNVVRQLANLGRDRIFREVDEVVGANLHRLNELIYEEENRAHVEAGLLEALDTFFAQTPARLVESLPSSALDSLCSGAAAWAAARLRQPETARTLAALFERESATLFHTPLRELLRLSGTEAEAPRRWVAALGTWAAAGGLEQLVGRLEPTVRRAAFDVPLGRLSRVVPESLARELIGVAAERLMPAVAAQVPEILRIVDVEGLIEREVLHLEASEIERVIVSVARKELGAIAWWGGVLGALVIAAQILLQRLSLQGLLGG